MSDKSKQIGLRIDAKTREIIEDELDYGDHISEWVRGAIKLRIEQEGLANPEDFRATMMSAD